MYMARRHEATIRFWRVIFIIFAVATPAAARVPVQILAHDSEHGESKVALEKGLNRNIEESRVPPGPPAPFEPVPIVLMSNAPPSVAKTTCTQSSGPSPRHNDRTPPPPLPQAPAPTSLV